MGLAIDSHLTTRGPDQPLTVDALVAAARDDTRYVIVRAEVVITVETADGRFEQLADGSGSYTPAAGETLTRAGLTLDVREGG